MQKRIFLVGLALALIILPFLTSMTFAQSPFPKGAYLSLEEMISRSPSLDVGPMELKKRTKANKFWSGGNDFKLKSEEIANGRIKRKWYAYSDGKDLYVNCRKHKLQNHFSKALTQGNFIFFEALLTKGQKSFVLNVFPPIARSIILSKQFLYLLDLSSKTIRKADDELIEKILRTDDKLYAAFEAELIQSRRQALAYVSKLNAKYESEFNVQDNQASSKESKAKGPLKVIDLVLYREDKKEREEPIEVLLADSLTHPLTPNSIWNKNMLVSEEYLEVCLNSSNCFKIDLTESLTPIIKLSYKTKESEPQYELVDQTTADWDLTRIRRKQK